MSIRRCSAVDKADDPGIHIFIATSDIHLKYKLNMTREDVLTPRPGPCTRAKKHLDYIEFSCEDASRSDWDYMVSVVHRGGRAGATIINLPDTTGHAIPEEYGRMFAIYARARPGRRATSSGARIATTTWASAVANSLAAMRRRSAADRMHHQWHRRARRQHLDGRSGDGAQDAQGPDGRRRAASTRARFIRPRACSRR